MVKGPLCQRVLGWLQRTEWALSRVLGELVAVPIDVTEALRVGVRSAVSLGTAEGVLASIALEVKDPELSGLTPPHPVAPIALPLP